jgi:hypothetical protein
MSAGVGSEGGAIGIRLGHLGGGPCARRGGARPKVGRSSLAALLASLCALVGCSPSVEVRSGPADAGGEAPADAGQPDCHDPVVGCTAHGERQCLKLADCGMTPLSFEACEAMWRDFCLSRLVIADSSFDACDFAACPDLEHTDCYQSCPLSHREGTRPVGASCRFSLSCATGYCAQSTDASCGTCQPMHGPDELCGSSALCAPGLACYKTAGETASTCRPELPLGAACLPTEECSNLLTCSFGVCSLPPSEGEPCDGKGLHSCAYPWLCLDGVCASGSTSAPSPGLGEPCTESCKLGALCEAGICQLAALSGEPCVNDEAAPANQRCASYPGFGCIDGICKWKPLIDGCSP